MVIDEFCDEPPSICRQWQSLLLTEQKEGTDEKEIIFSDTIHSHANISYLFMQRRSVSPLERIYYAEEE